MRRIINGNPVITSRHGQPTFLGLFRKHLGYDYSLPVGTPLYAPVAGKIRLTTYSPTIGYNLELEGGGYYHRALHMSKFNVRAGQEVPEGYLIGWSGNTGKTTGPHCHHDTRRPSAWNAGFNNYVDWEEKLLESSLPTTPTAPAVNPSVIGKTLYLKPVTDKWRIYHPSIQPKAGKEIAYLNPKKYGGLSYIILGVTYPQTVIIQTVYFGRVAIYVDKDAEIR